MALLEAHLSSPQLLYWSEHLLLFANNTMYVCVSAFKLKQRVYVISIK